MISNTAGDNL